MITTDELFIDLSKPTMWSKDYFNLPHVKAINQTIEHYNDGLLTTRELAWNILFQYENGYLAGLEDANYPLPSIYCHSLMSRLTDDRSDEVNMFDFTLSMIRK